MSRRACAEELAAQRRAHFEEEPGGLVWVVGDRDFGRGLPHARREQRAHHKRVSGEVALQHAAAKRRRLWLRGERGVREGERGAGRQDDLAVDARRHGQGHEPRGHFYRSGARDAVLSCTSPLSRLAVYGAQDGPKAKRYLATQLASFLLSLLKGNGV